MLLKFRTADLRPLVEHARSGKEFCSVYGQSEVGPALLLVKDEGAYFMSNGLPRLPRTDGTDGSHVVYAEGCRPEDGHIGGDDWVEVFRLADLEPLLNRAYIEVVVSRHSMQLRTYDAP